MRSPVSDGPELCREASFMMYADVMHFTLHKTEDGARQNSRRPVFVVVVFVAVERSPTLIVVYRTRAAT